MMKPPISFLSCLCVLAVLTVAAPPCSNAQTEQTTTTTVTTTVIPASPTPAPGVVIPATGQVIAVQPTPVVVVPQPGQHVADIEMTVSRGAARAYFGRAPRGEKADIGGLHLDIKLPSTATVTQIVSRGTDADQGPRITAENPWHVVVPFDGAGRFVFNIVGWDNDPIVTSCVVKIDGVVVFSGHGRDDDFDNWAHVTYGAGVRKTGSREIAFNLAAAQ